MNKILLSLTLALGLFGIAQATVPQRRQFTHKQPDGTSLRLTSRCQRTLHYLCHHRRTCRAAWHRR